MDKQNRPENQDRLEKKVIQPGGLSNDTSLVNQPVNTTRFALNAVNESAEGDVGFISNENSNEACYELPAGYVPLGKVYVGNQEEVIFLADGGGNSMIVLLDRECNLTILVDDSGQAAKLGFRISHQIDATFRLRRGCERTLYWVDPKPRIYIIEKPEDFQDDTTGEWDITRFNLFKTYASIPDFVSVDVLDGGGNLAPGSYNFSIQYLDADLNPTEFVTSTETVAIYNSNLSLPFRDIRGSIAAPVPLPYNQFGNTDKAIRITLANLDTSFPFYRLAITEANNASGEISDTKYTAEISTLNTVFTYTGSNYESTGSQEEIVPFNTIVDAAEHIEQLENRLLLGNVEGKQINFCKLQKYASQITADMVTKTTVLTAMVPGNSKFPTAHIDGMGYMPGEIYSFGIVYIFDDNTLSPVYHIPGKNPNVAPTTMYSTGPNVYPMDNTNNQSQDNRYIDNNNCGTAGYWGVDSEGLTLENTLVRHHRFPLRTAYNIPFVEKVDSTTASTLFKIIKINATGNIDIPVICAPPGDVGYDPSCVPLGAPPFSITIFFTEDGVPSSYTVVIDPANWSGGTSPAPIIYNAVSNVLSGTNVVITSIEEEGVVVPGTWSAGVYTSTSTSPKGLDYNISLADSLQEFTDDVYTAPLMGIRFSNIQVPSSADLNGNKIIGYYIVRNERVEDEKTILDSAVLTSTIKNAAFVSAGLLMPQFGNDSLVKKDIVNMINPEFKFNNKKYVNYDNIIQQGRYNRIEAILSRFKINDVLDGSGYVHGKHKDGESDDDGWTLQCKTRDNIMAFQSQANFNIPDTDIKETFYLDALADKFILDSANAGADVFNLACDNKTGIISLDHNITFPIMNSVPYVYIYKGNANPYNNFRLTPYYKESQNPQYFGINTTVSCDTWNGDSYISPIRYVNSIFYDNRVKKRAGKTSVWNYILGAIIIVVAVVLAYFTAGTSLALIGVGVAVAAVGIGVGMISAGIKQDAWNKAYNQLYDQGLRETIADDYVRYDSDPYNGESRGFVKNPSDDELQWLGDCLNLWFESAVNMNLRHGMTDNTPDHLNAPGLIEQGTGYSEWDREYFGIHSVGSESIPPTTALDNHMLKKLTTLNASRREGRYYNGIAFGEIYQLNPDYKRRNKQKIFNHLGLEYDCCSDCFESFPNRYHWSEQSFQEELTDNFRLFLPNNYKDLEGNTGSITDMFRIKSNLYIHTEESLWHLPQNLQERITGDIVSFLGTGEYFNIPPRKIVDDEDSSAGTLHKWGRLKTKYGILFPCHKEKKWYMFNGEKLEPISNAFMSSHFREAMRMYLDEAYYNLTGLNYPYANNPSHRIGTGYLSAYDSTKERLIVTKKDKILAPDQLEPGTQICDEGEQTIIFPDLAGTIAAQEELGWTYVGMQDCVLQFEMVTYEEQVVTQQIITTVPNTAHVYAMYDTSGSFLPEQLATVQAAVIAWYTDFRPWDTTFSLLHHINDASERWLAFPANAVAGQDVLVLTFVNEANPVYHGIGLEATLAAPTGTYAADYAAFINTIFPSLNSFIGINYPIMTGNVQAGAGICFLQHSLAAVKGRDYTLAEVNLLEPNSYYSPATWSVIKTALMSNPYNVLVDGLGVPGLEKYNWIVKSNKNDLGTVATADCPASAEIISPCQFAQDINTILADFTTITEVDVTILVPVTQYMEIEGTPIELETYNSGWTMSYSLKNQQWVSWHSYIPNFYITLQERFYSWIDSNNFIWKHNRKNHYQTFYGEYHPYIIEYVDMNNPLFTQITDGILFQTEAKRFSEATEEFYDIPDVTFNKILAYNTHQITGLLDMVPKSNTSANYLYQQTINANNAIILDRNERNWTINTLRNLRSNNTASMFIKAVPALQAAYYIDKIVNPAAIDYNKDWTQLDSLRDKFLVIRLIFDTFDNTRLIMNFAVEDKKVSER